MTGIVSDTVFRNTVSESRIVTPVKERDWRWYLGGSDLAHSLGIPAIF